MRLGTVVPNFTAETTKGQIKFYDWQGDSWVVLFSHPADFTPVCTTELSRIAVNQPEFGKRNTKCLAHSVDDLKSHLAWVSDIKSYCSDVPEEYPYPIIADPERDLAVTFGMLDESQKTNPEIGKTIRALLIISPDHRLRLSMFYPVEIGRNVDEILRCLDALQTADKLKVIATPANWEPGSKVMILPSVSNEEANELFPKGFDMVYMPSALNYVRTTDNY